MLHCAAHTTQTPNYPKRKWRQGTPATVLHLCSPRFAMTNYILTDPKGSCWRVTLGEISLATIGNDVSKFTRAENGLILAQSTKHYRKMGQKALRRSHQLGRWQMKRNFSS